MMYLGLAILSSALISVLMRLSEKHTKSSLAMLAANYGACGLLAAVFAGEGGIDARPGGGLFGGASSGGAGAAQLGMRSVDRKRQLCYTEITIRKDRRN